MNYQEDRIRRIDIFEDTLQYCERSCFLMDAIKLTRENTILYQKPMEECSGMGKHDCHPCDVMVLPERTLGTAGRLHREYPGSRIGILNSASGMYPGGEVLRGGVMQEECLCRCSTLYPCLNTDRLLHPYYIYNREQGNPLYTDACIFTPGIVGIKTDTRWPEQMQESEWFYVDVISCAPPNVRGAYFGGNHILAGESPCLSDQELRDLLKKRITGILYVSARHGIDILVADAFVSGTSPHSSYMAAQAFKEALEQFRYSFKKIVFAVYSPSRNWNHYDIFSSVFGVEAVSKKKVW